METDTNAPNINFNLEADQIENMTPMQLQEEINRLETMITQIRTYALENDVDVPAGSSIDITSYINAQDSMIANLENQIDKMKQRLMRLQEQVSIQGSELQTSESELRNRQARILAQEREIDEKRKLVSTRDRMLQLSVEKNMYKKKVIYSLLSAIIAVFILMLVGYGYMSRSS